MIEQNTPIQNAPSPVNPENIPPVPDEGQQNPPPVNGQNPPAPKAPEAPKVPDKTSEEIRRNQAHYYGRDGNLGEFKMLADQVNELSGGKLYGDDAEDAGNAEKIQGLQDQITGQSLELARRDAADLHGLSRADGQMLKGNTPEELNASAEYLSKRIDFSIAEAAKKFGQDDSATGDPQSPNGTPGTPSPPIVPVTQSATPVTKMLPGPANSGPKTDAQVEAELTESLENHDFGL